MPEIKDVFLEFKRAIIEYEGNTGIRKKEDFETFVNWVINGKRFE